jgi:deoxyribodipyrimidine photo-lyase
MEGVTHPSAVVWLRRDLRLHDHSALAAAIEAAGSGRLAPLYVLDERLLAGRWASGNRTWFLLGSLRSLDADLRTLGSRLHVRVGDPREAVPAFAAEAGAETVHVTDDVSPYARTRDRAVASRLEVAGRRLVAHPGLLVHDPDAVRTRDGRPYTVFSPYRRAWEQAPRRAVLPRPAALPAAPERLDPGVLPDPASLGPAPTADPATMPEPGEPAARRRLDAWLARGLHAYAERRNDLDGATATSRLSQDLRFGLLSPLEVVERALAAPDAQAVPEPLTLGLDAGGPLDARARGNAPGLGEREDGRSTWLAEVCWRDFYLQLLAHHPRVLREPFRVAFDRLDWSADEAAIDAWREGRTGYPVVDAAMRQLVATGFVPNRARMIVASFLAKDLLADWRAGETHFMRHLVDGDPAANDGGWQWSASTGTDAQPWFRVFDPVSQGRRFDPDGSYVRRWLPELARVPTELVHTPWAMSADEQVAAGCRIGVDYPERIVDHAEARGRWLAAVDAAGISPAAR